MKQSPATCLRSFLESLQRNAFICHYLLTGGHLHSAFICPMRQFLCVVVTLHILFSMRLFHKVLSQRAEVIGETFLYMPLDVPSLTLHCLSRARKVRDTYIHEADS